MELEIRQTKVALAPKYSIFVNGNETFSATSRLFRFLADITIVDSGGNRTAHIKKKFSFLKANYEIVLNGVDIYQLKTKSIWKSTYTLSSGDKTFDIYGHRGRKHSIYISDTQVAYFVKDLVTWFDGDVYKAVANNDIDLLLITSIVICLDNHMSHSSDGNTVTFDFGKIGPEAKPFDTSWKPRSVTSIK